MWHPKQSWITDRVPSVLSALNVVRCVVSGQCRLIWASPSSVSLNRDHYWITWSSSQFEHAMDFPSWWLWLFRSGSQTACIRRTQRPVSSRLPAPNPEPLVPRSGEKLRICMSSQFPGEADAGGLDHTGKPDPTLSGPRHSLPFVPCSGFPLLPQK